VSERLRKNLMKYGICGGICLIYAAWHCFSRNVLEMSATDLYRTVGDSYGSGTSVLIRWSYCVAFQ